MQECERRVRLNREGKMLLMTSNESHDMAYQIHEGVLMHSEVQSRKVLLELKLS
jgi:hypothetical protein